MIGLATQAFVEELGAQVVGVEEPIELILYEERTDLKGGDYQSSIVDIGSELIADVDNPPLYILVQTRDEDLSEELLQKTRDANNFGSNENTR